MNPATSTPPATILAVDDEPALLDAIRITLEAAGYTVLTASTGNEAVKTFAQRAQEIKLVLLDYLLPDMTGDSVFDCLQRIDPDVRIILLTGCDDHVTKTMFTRGLRGYMAKPFYLDDLIQRVRDEMEAL